LTRFVPVDTPGGGSALHLRYLAARALRRVERAESDGSCRHLQGPVQIVRGLSEPERHELESLRPGYLVLEFEESPQPDLRSLTSFKVAG
jgi:hypothetical protein